MSAPLSLLSGISREEAEHLQRHSGLASPETIAIGAYIDPRSREYGAGGYRHRRRTNGVGGELIANLARLGVGPEEIDVILLTHAHRTISAACCPPLVRQRIPTPRCSCLRGKALTGWQHPRSTTPAIAAGATCCLFAVYWRTARRKSAGLMMRK